MSKYFSIYEFIVDPTQRHEDSLVPLHVANKIMTYHIPELERMQESFIDEIYISQHSGYRSQEWEIAKGRDGNSQHTFKHLGAVDLATNGNIVDFVRLCRESSYKRVCYYPYKSFVHLDFLGDRRVYFEADRQGKWQFKYYRDDK